MKLIVQRSQYYWFPNVCQEDSAFHFVNAFVINCTPAIIPNFKFVATNFPN